MAANDGHNMNKREAEMNPYLTWNQDKEAA
jgi:hypothetical protein